MTYADKRLDRQKFLKMCQFLSTLFKEHLTYAAVTNEIEQ
jgi:hypothetical protein